MSPRKRVMLLIGIMTAVTVSIETVTLILLYRTALNEEKARLVETAKSHARLIEAVARFDAVNSPSSPQATPVASRSEMASGGAASVVSQGAEVMGQCSSLGF